MVLKKIPRKTFPLSQKPSKIVYYLLINETVPSNAIKHNAPATQRPGTEEKQGFPTMQFFSPLSHKADLSRIRLTWLGRQRDHELIGLSFLSPPSPSKLLGLSFPERSLSILSIGLYPFYPLVSIHSINRHWMNCGNCLFHSPSPIYLGKLITHRAKSS